MAESADKPGHTGTLTAQTIFEVTADSWIVVNAEGHPVLVNPAAQRLLEEAGEPDVPADLLERLPSLKDTPFAKEYERARRERTPGEVVSWWEPKQAWLRARTLPLPGDGLAFSLTDVSALAGREPMLEAERRLRDGEERLRLATVAADIGTWDYDGAHGTFISSGLSRRMFGLSETGDSPPYRAFHERIHPDDILGVEATARQAITKRSDFQSEFRVLLPDGTTRWIAATGMRVQGGLDAQPRYFGTFLDISEHKHAEEELVRQAEQLARSNADLQQFAYVTSHDMQEPLRSIASFAQLLAQRYRGKLDDDADEFVGYIINGVRRMSLLIDDLLVYSRVVNVERAPSSQVDMNSVLQWAKINLQQALFESRGHISQEHLPSVTGDQIQLVQVLQNLLSNAIKYHRRDIPPYIRVTAKRENDAWIFAVQDNGIGIEAQFQDRVFGLFKRLHGRDVPGTGIGLAICRKVVEKHGGRIWVESEPGQGSTFYFTLPVS